MILLAGFGGEPSPVKSTVTKAVAEFRRTHADTWDIQKNSFSEDQIEVALMRYSFPKHSYLILECLIISSAVLAGSG